MARHTFTKIKPTKPPVCPECGSTHVIGYGSIDRRYCEECKATWDWPLKPGQESVLENRKGL